MEGKIQKRAKKGFTLIEVLIDAFVLTAIFGVLVGTFIITIRAVNNGRVRVSASALANEQMEKLRNLPYDQLATEHGTILPQGNIPDTQNITRSLLGYSLMTEIVYIDDPYDGCAVPAGSNLYQCTDGSTSATQDIVPVDYKRITVKVTQTSDTIILAELSSNASAKAAETASNTGMLFLIIRDAQGNPIEGALVIITNPETGVSIQAYSNALGQVFVANMPPDNQNGYHVVASKDGYSSDFTTPRTSQNPNQFQPDLDIHSQQVTTQTLTLDHLSQLQVNVKDEVGSPVSGMVVTATSSKILQFNPEVPKHVYTATTDSAGLANFSDIEWDSYAFTVPSDFSLLITSPYQKVVINPGVVVTVTLVATTQLDWPFVTTVNPSSATIGSMVTILIEGGQLLGDTSVVLRLSGQTDIIPTVINRNPNKLSVGATFNLTGVVAGEWDIVITTNNRTIIQPVGFVIS